MFNRLTEFYNSLDRKTIVSGTVTGITTIGGIFVSIYGGQTAKEKCEEDVSNALPTSFKNEPFTQTVTIGGYAVNIDFPASEIPINQTSLEGIIQTAGEACEYDITTKLALLSIIALSFGSLLTYQYYKNNQIKQEMKKLKGEEMDDFKINIEQLEDDKIPLNPTQKR